MQVKELNTKFLLTQFKELLLEDIKFLSNLQKIRLPGNFTDLVDDLILAKRLIFNKLKDGSAIQNSYAENENILGIKKKTTSFTPEDMVLIKSIYQIELDQKIRIERIIKIQYFSFNIKEEIHFMLDQCNQITTELKRILVENGDYKFESLRIT